MDQIGKILWQDLTVENAEEIRDFYCGVLGWTFTKVNQGDYDDYNMVNPQSGDEVVAGICHKRGVLADFPPQWLNYVVVDDLAGSMEKCRSLGGKIVNGPTIMGKSSLAIIQDPAGAYLALMSDLDPEEPTVVKPA